MNFTNEKGEKEHPVIIHRAIFGSFDRIFAFLVEKTGGNFPVWLSPIQVLIIPVGEKFNEYGEKVLMGLKDAGIRAELDQTNETLGKKSALASRKNPLPSCRRRKRKRSRNGRRQFPRQRKTRNFIR